MSNKLYNNDAYNFGLFGTESLPWDAEEEVGGGIHIVNLVPPVPKREFNSAYTDAVTEIAKDDPVIMMLAQQLSDEVDGIGITSALKVLAGCGMILNHYDKEKQNEQLDKQSDG